MWSSGFGFVLRPGRISTQEPVGCCRACSYPGVRSLLPRPQCQGRGLSTRDRRLPTVRLRPGRKRDRALSRRPSRTGPGRALRLQHHRRVPNRQARDLTPSRSAPPRRRGLAPSPVCRGSFLATLPRCAAAKRTLNSPRDGADASLDAFARLRFTRAIGQLFDLAPQLAILGDQLRDHCIQLSYEISTPDALTPRSSFRSRRPSPTPRCFLLCFLWCHFHSWRKRNRAQKL